MNYELAKELKEAGFPQSTSKRICPHGYQGYLPNGCEQEGCDVSYPSLSELIEACSRPDGRFTLNNNIEDPKGAGLEVAWYAQFIRPAPEDETSVARGSTPEEAVARLWLALNKK